MLHKMDAITNTTKTNYTKIAKNSIFLKIGSFLSVSTILIGLTACSLENADKDEYANSSAEEIYQEAVTHLDKGRFEPASKSYEALENHFPFGETTTKGQLEVIYAYYKDQEYLQSITAAERFLRLHPLNEHADYAHYMKAISYFDQTKTMLSRWIATNPALRDVSNYQAAFKSFQTIVKNYPQSKYANDSRAHMVYIRNVLAAHELSIANYYIERNADLAAANRAKYILEHLPNTPAEKPALDLLQNQYEKLKITSLLKEDQTNLNKKKA